MFLNSSWNGNSKEQLVLEILKLLLCLQIMNSADLFGLAVSHSLETC